MPNIKSILHKRSLVNGLAGMALAAGMASVAHAGAMASATTPSINDYVATQGDHANWILPAKNYDNDRYVDLSAITPSNVGQLKPAWTFKIDDNGPIEAAPIIWHGIAYITSAHDHVYAIDVKTGKLNGSSRTIRMSFPSQPIAESRCSTARFTSPRSMAS
ncbi:PQQ-binding-like beta-propeller repeat protein [Acidiphilium acidophilum]|nr:PQQ-binding-like beta-propeller repeat protein [Acidiphilium acidophilum]